jgi:hypothetical protein
MRRETPEKRYLPSSVGPVKVAPTGMSQRCPKADVAQPRLVQNDGGAHNGARRISLISGLRSQLSWRYVYFFQMVTIGGVVAASAKGVKPYSARSVLSTL